MTVTKQLTIAGTTDGAQQDYVVRLLVNRGSGPDTVGGIPTVYTDGATRDDFNDLRFTDTQGTPLTHWSEPVLVSDEITQKLDGSWIEPDGTIWGGIGNKLWRSTDRGATWDEIFTVPGNPEWLHLVYVDRDSNIYTSGFRVDSADAGLWRSTDGGTSWTKVLDVLAMHSICMIDQDSQGRLFAGHYTQDTAPEDAIVWRSTDGGTTWTKVYEDTDARHTHALAVDPWNDNVYVTTGDFSPAKIDVSTDAGETWTSIATGLANQAVGIGITENARFFGCDTSGTWIKRTTDDAAVTTVYESRAGGDNIGHFWRMPYINGWLISGGVIIRTTYDTPQTGAGTRTGIVATRDNGATWVGIEGFPIPRNSYDGWVASNVGPNDEFYYQNGASTTRRITAYEAVYVKVPSIPASPGTVDIVMEYGTLDAPDVRDGAGTFALFDDFSAATLNGDVWEAGQSGTQTAESATAVANGRLELRVGSTSGDVRRWVATKARLPARFAVGGRMTFAPSTSSTGVTSIGVVADKLVVDDDVLEVQTRLAGEDVRRRVSGTAGTIHDNGRPGRGNWYEIAHRSATDVRVERNFATMWEGDAQASVTDEPHLVLGTFADDAGTTLRTFESVHVRPYASPEPAVTSIAAAVVAGLFMLRGGVLVPAAASVVRNGVFIPAT